MTLLNTPMPAEKALDTIRSIYDSNRMVEIIIQEEVTNFPTQEYYVRGIVGKNITVRNERMGSTNIHLSRPVKIQIVPIIPKYEAGDRVMILSTGDIGEVIKIRGDHRDKPIELNNDTDQFYHRSEICKLPNDL